LSLLEDLNSLAPKKLPLNEWVDNLTPEELAAFIAVTQAKTSTESLIDILRKNGCAVTRGTLNQWRAEHAAR